MTALVPAGENIWTAEGPVVSFYGFPYPTRSVVVRLAGGELWVWSPVALDGQLRAEVEAIGRPAHVVSPNKLHHLYLGAWHAAFPDARLWAPASTQRKRRDLPFQPALTDQSPADWHGQIEQCWVNGSLVMDEIVFFHLASRTAIIADLSQTFTPEWLARHWSGWLRGLANLSGIVAGKGYAPFEWRMTFVRRERLRAAKAKMLGWRPEQVIVAHGQCQRDGGTAFLARALAWMG